MHGSNRRMHNSHFFSEIGKANKVMKNLFNLAMNHAYHRHFITIFIKTVLNSELICSKEQEKFGPLKKILN